MDITQVVAPRRIVTGLGPDRRSHLARVEEMEPVRAGYVVPLPVAALEPTWQEPRGTYYRVWGSDRLPVPLPTDGRAPLFDSAPTPEETPEALRIAAACPPPLGFRVAWADYGGASRPPGVLHWHDSVDIRFVMCGRYGHVMDSGEEFVLRAGDVWIQNATNHAHHAFSGDRVVVGTVVVGALRAGPHPPLEELHPVQRGPAGGHRSGETRGKLPMPPWAAPVPASSLKPGDGGELTSYSQVERPRLVTTGMGADGRTHIARADEIDEVAAMPGLHGGGDEVGGYFPMWAADRLPLLLPTDGLAPALDSLPGPDQALEALRRADPVPPPLGFRVTVSRVPPSRARGALHWRDTVDVMFVMHGEVVHILDSGEEIALRAGDTLIQNGTNHCWHNRGEETTWIGVVTLPGVRFGAAPPPEDLHPAQRAHQAPRR